MEVWKMLSRLFASMKFTWLLTNFFRLERGGYDASMGVKVAQLASVIKSLMNDQVVAEEIIAKHGDVSFIIETLLIV